MHTPGPWEWRSEYRLYGGEKLIAELHRDSPDARLIAAAPDLLAAAEEHVADCCECCASSEPLRAAIAEAKRES